MDRLPEVTLTRVDPAASELYRTWINDPDTNRWMLSGVPPVSSDEERSIVERMSASDTDEVFEIRVDGRPVGLVGLHHMDPVHRSAELGIVVGDVEVRGRGIGAAAIRAALRHGFTERGLESIHLGCFAENDAALRSYERAGFVRVGVSRRRYFRHGAFHDSVLFDMTREDWERGDR